MKRAELKDKVYLNLEEAIEHWNLSRRKFYRFIGEGSHSFIALYGSRKLIIRTAFEEYLNEPGRKEMLKNGTSKKRLKA